MSNHPWQEVLERIEQTLTQVAAAAHTQEVAMSQSPAEVPLDPESAWQARLLAWDKRLASLPLAAQEAERECRETDGRLAQEEQALQTWLAAVQATRQRLADWDQRYAYNNSR